MYVTGGSKVLLDGPRAELIDPIHVSSGTLQLYIPAGFRYDGASIPAIAWGVIGHPFQRGFIRASAVHDYLLIYSTVSWPAANKIFYQILRYDEVVWWKAAVMYTGVRLYYMISKLFKHRPLPIK